MAAPQEKDIQAMRKSRFSPPYKAPGKTNFPGIRGKSGVYLIKENGKLVYVGYSETNLYRTMYRHFESWTHKSQEVITYASKMSRNKYTVRVVLCGPKKAAQLERSLIIKHRPKDNANKYTNYTLEFRDKQVVQDYIKVEQEAPF